MFKMMLNPKRAFHRLPWVVTLMLASAVLLSVGLATPASAHQPIPYADTGTPLGEPPFAPPQSDSQIVSQPERDNADLAAQKAAANLDYAVYIPLANIYRDQLTVNPQNKNESSNFYNQYYASIGDANQQQADAQRQQADAATTTINPAWTGNHSTCDAGDISSAFRDATLLRINYFRAMAGIPANVKFVDEYNRKAQQAALMMSANNQLSHSPDSSWRCYTDAGEQAAGSSNLYLGVYGWNAISGYIQDPGAGNFFAGHRRWILYPQTQFMGSGDIPATANYRRANTLWVFDDHTWDPRPETREEFVAWPPPGYTPYQVVFPLWSFAYADADFSNATVTMTADDRPVSLTIHDLRPGYGENTLTWAPAISLGRPASDVRYTVEVRNVRINGGARDFTYDVTMFDPDA